MKKRMSVVASGFAMAYMRKIQGSAQFASTCQPSHAEVRSTYASRFTALRSPPLSIAAHREPALLLSQVLHVAERDRGDEEEDRGEGDLDRRDPADRKQPVRRGAVEDLTDPVEPQRDRQDRSHDRDADPHGAHREIE